MTDAELVRRMTDMYIKAYQDAVKEYERLWNLIDDVSTGKKKPPSFYDTPEKVAKWKQGFIRSQFRQENVVANIAKKLAEVGVDVRPVIKSYIHYVYRYNRELAIGGIKRAVNINFDQYDKRQIDILLDDEQPVFSKIAYRNLGKNGIIVDRLQREFAAGIINGDDKTKMLKRVQKVTGQSRYQAWRVAQTERTRVSSQARDRVINEAAAQGVIVLKEWSTRMRNSREAHISLDGQRVASGEVFHVNPENDVISRSKKNGVRLGTGYDIAYPGDPSAPARAVCNCYCVLIPRVLKNGQTADWSNTPPEEIEVVPQQQNVASEATKEQEQQLTIESAKDKEQLFTAAKDLWDVNISDTVKELDFEKVKETFVGIKYITDAYPEIGVGLSNIGTGKDGVMSCGGGKIEFNPAYYEVGGKIETARQRMVERGLWPKNSSIASIGTHEAAHSIEWFLATHNPSYQYRWESIEAWNKCTEAKVIVSQACKNIKKTPDGKGKLNNTLITEISRYATENASESLAEAFADYYSNKENAAPLSKEIVQLTTERYKAYGGTGNGY